MQNSKLLDDVQWCNISLKFPNLERKGLGGGYSPHKRVTLQNCIFWTPLRIFSLKLTFTGKNGRMFSIFCSEIFGCIWPPEQWTLIEDILNVLTSSERLMYVKFTSSCPQVRKSLKSLLIADQNISRKLVDYLLSLMGLRGSQP